MARDKAADCPSPEISSTEIMNVSFPKETGPELVMHPLTKMLKLVGDQKMHILDSLFPPIGF